MNKKLLGGGVDKSLVEKVAKIFEQLSENEVDRLIVLAKERRMEIRDAVIKKMKAFRKK